MNNLSESVQREFTKWKEKYDIPYSMEFHLKTLLKLQEEYDEVEIGSNTTKTRETILHMIQDLQRQMVFKEKIIPKIHNYKILVVGNVSELITFTNLMHMVINKNDIKLLTESRNHKTTFILYNGVIIECRVKNENELIGLTADEFIDLTNDFTFQNNILKSICCKKQI